MTNPSKRKLLSLAYYRNKRHLFPSGCLDPARDKKPLPDNEHLWQLLDRNIDLDVWERRP